MSLVLRPYQERALDRARAAYRTHRSVLLVAPTGAGKTVIFAAVALGAIAKGRRVLVVVHRRELVRQTIAKLQNAGIDRVGVIAAGWARDPDAPVQVAMVQSMLAAAHYPPATLVILDEAHHHVAAEWGLVAARYATAKVLGVTATPERGDGAALGDLFDAIVPVASIRELTALGYLCPLDVVAPEGRRQHLAEDPVRAYLELAPGRQCVLFAASVAEAEGFRDRLSAAGYPTAAISGETPAADRDAVLARFAAGEIRVVCNVFVLTEGWDCPSVEVCLLARGCGSVGTYLQMVGRVLRPHPGKARALLIDLRGCVHEHGLPQEDRDYSLDGVAISAPRAAAARRCRECGWVGAPGTPACPDCGYVFPAPAPQQVERAKLETVRERATREESEGRALFEQARRAGRKPGWAAHRHVELFGRFPAKLWREYAPR